MVNDYFLLMHQFKEELFFKFLVLIIHSIVLLLGSTEETIENNVFQVFIKTKLLESSRSCNFTFCERTEAEFQEF
jgi:hypothetical protein